MNLFKIYLFLLLLLCGCASKQPSETIIDTAQKEITTVQETIKKLEKQTPKECKTEAFMANLDSVKVQVSNISLQLDNTKNACNIEKEVLEEKITTRNIAIIGLLVILLLLGIILFRR